MRLRRSKDADVWERAGPDHETLIQRLAVTYATVVGLRHDCDQLGKHDLRAPTELGRSFVWSAHQGIDFGRAIVAWIDFDDGASGFGVDSGFMRAVAAPFKC